MADHTADSRISLHPHTPRVCILTGSTLIADTRNVIDLRERGYPPRQYLLLSDVDMSLLSVSSSVTHCSLKGDSTYFSLRGIADVAWSYEQPIDEMRAIAGRLAFDTRNVAEASVMTSAINPKRIYQ